jgi:two-component system NarL family response regulator
MFGGVKSDHKVPRVVLADDHHFFREGLRDKLEDDGMNVVGDAADGTEAIALAGRLEPDIVVADLSMPGASGIEVVRQVLAKSAEVSVIILTVSADIRSALEALNAGASGYLLKETPVDDIVSTVRLVASGQTVISGGLIPQLLASVGAVERSPASRARQRAGDLTARELEVLKLIAGGADNAAIGRELSISRHTVKRYVTNIFEKLGVGSRVEAAVYAVRAELV